MKKVIVSSLLLILIAAFIICINVGKENNINYILLDSQTMEEIGSISNYSFVDGKLDFTCNGEDYNFSLQKLNEENGVKLYSGNNNNICCNLAQRGDDVSIQVINTDINPENRTLDNKNFTIIVTEKEKQGLLKDIANNKEWLEDGV